MFDKVIPYCQDNAEQLIKIERSHHYGSERNKRTCKLYCYLFIGDPKKVTEFAKADNLFTSLSKNWLLPSKYF